MKKCLVLKQMLQPEFDSKFTELRIVKRLRRKYFPQFGTIRGEVTHYEYQFRSFFEQVLI